MSLCVCDVAPKWTERWTDTPGGGRGGHFNGRWLLNVKYESRGFIVRVCEKSEGRHCQATWKERQKKDKSGGCGEKVDDERTEWPFKCSSPIRPRFYFEDVLIWKRCTGVNVCCETVVNKKEWKWNCHFCVNLWHNAIYKRYWKSLKTSLESPWKVHEFEHEKGVRTLLFPCRRHQRHNKPIFPNRINSFITY